MMRWKALVGLALILAAAVGCERQCFLTEADADHYFHDLHLPPNLEAQPEASCLPADANDPEPTTVNQPERPVRHLSLAEAMAMALEHGTVGSPFLTGTSNDSLVSFQNGGVGGPESPIRVLALDPAITGSNIEASLAKFDARWTASMTWQKIDEPWGRPTVSRLLSPRSFQNGDLANFSTALLKPLPTGGVAGITFNTQYTNLSTPATGFLNPAYRPSLQFQFEQPLLQGFGVEINQLRATHPGSLLTPFNTGSRVEGILITRIRFDQQRAEFERQVNTLLVNVEVAYWNLYGAYWSLYSREQALRQAYEAWRINKARFDRRPIHRSGPRPDPRAVRAVPRRAAGSPGPGAGKRAPAPRPDGFAGRRTAHRLVPIDEPTLAAYQPDWHTALNEALDQRPELVLARQELKARQLDVINQKNLLLPDLRFTSTYNVNGLGLTWTAAPTIRTTPWQTWPATSSTTGAWACR